MKIKTKFNVGDKVWGIECIDDKWFIYDKFIIARIMIERDSKSKKEQVIYVDSKEWGYWLYSAYKEKEENCFATKKEAKQECRRRNGNKN